MITDAYDEIQAALDAPLIVVTTEVDGERSGCLVGFHSQSSIEPRQHCIWISKANHTYQLARRATHFALHFLTEYDHSLAQHFGELTGDETDKFDGLPFSAGPGNVPILDGCEHWVVIERATMQDEDAAGDHACITGTVIAAKSSGTFRPFRLTQAKDFTPGHEAEEA